MLTYLDTFVAAYAGFGVLDDYVFVKAKELIDLAEYLFGASLQAGPARLAVSRISHYVGCTQYSVLFSHTSFIFVGKGTTKFYNYV